MGFAFLKAWKSVSYDNLRSQEKCHGTQSIVKGTSHSHKDISEVQRSLSSSKLSCHLNMKKTVSSTSIHNKSTVNFSNYLSETDSDWCINMDNNGFFRSFKEKNGPLSSCSGDRVSSSCESSYFPSPEKKKKSNFSNNKQIIEAICSLDINNKLLLSLEQRNSAENEKIDFHAMKVNRFKQILEDANVDLDILKKHAWNGVPDEFRPTVWKLLLGYLPCNASRREIVLSRKRNEYYESVLQTYGKGTKELDQSLERILYIWVIRHPASGYVQGISDLVTPFFQVFLSAYIDGNPELYDPINLPKSTLDIIEADTFWCTSKLLDGIQDNYIFAQPGIHRQIMNLKELTARIDHPLSVHLEKEGVEYIQFSFRWMNCILMREMSVKNTIRMWDTYLAEGQSAFSDFHVYVCAALLVKWSPQLLKMDFQEIIIFLQSLPTQNWTYKDIEILLSEAFLWKSLFSGAKAHLR
ncbi:hypothetical protein PORY_000593 [Pneumocystis oryctolagi]|uniref:Uncharacterized protein n=1 Tax=Pneumocystis oryctolagi TaxID=42067 RepID=A0ACB7CDM2_9ASCO|nr:hypothetical protein PORY_000593 [Pneumocystis oryctolagi]